MRLKVVTWNTSQSSQKVVIPSHAKIVASSSISAKAAKNTNIHETQMVWTFFIIAVVFALINLILYILYHKKSEPMSTPVVAIVMGSASDWKTAKHAADMLDAFGVIYVYKVLSAHRTPDMMANFAKNAESLGVQVILAFAGGAAHLPGMIAANTLLPVLGTPVPSMHLQGMDSLLSIVQMPKGIPVGTLAIGDAGAANAALLAIAFMANHNPDLRKRLRAYREEMANNSLTQEFQLPNTHAVQ
jgi:5-(carboxyamino)imidazole ribonucleotide mutase